MRHRALAAAVSKNSLAESDGTKPEPSASSLLTEPAGWTAGGGESARPAFTMRFAAFCRQATLQVMFLGVVMIPAAGALEGLSLPSFHSAITVNTDSTRTAQGN